MDKDEMVLLGAILGALVWHWNLRKAGWIVGGLGMLIGAALGAIVALSVYPTPGRGVNQAPPVPAEAEAEADPAPALPDHWYALHEGQEYGYERAQTESEVQSRQLSSPLLMVKYAGKRNGLQQIFFKELGGLILYECATPCEWVKMSIYMGGPAIKTERMKAAFGSLFWAMMADAQNGNLERFIATVKGKPHHVWFDQSGPHYSPVTEQRMNP